ncbi:DUF2690 domain-containing protein, partial [Streptomyces sp.]|uniref:DUF2690 domain-containing protein n=1 Tax=Streptomyces sp. TaxID=1931 RepID=UPI002F9340BC
LPTPPTPPAPPAPNRGPAGTGVPPPARGGRGRQRLTTLFATLLGALLVVVAAVLLADLGGAGDDGKRSAPPPSPTPSARPSTPLPAGVKCSGAGCAGQDPEIMGCGGEFAATVARTRVGTAELEVRHSSTCRAAWARLTEAAPGDVVRVSAAGTGGQEALVDADTDAYTPMVAVAQGTDAKACASLKSGATGCTGG